MKKKDEAALSDIYGIDAKVYSKWKEKLGAELCKQYPIICGEKENIYVCPIEAETISSRECNSENIIVVSSRKKDSVSGV